MGNPSAIPFVHTQELRRSELKRMACFHQLLPNKNERKTLLSPKGTVQQEMFEVTSCKSRNSSYGSGLDLHAKRRTGLVTSLAVMATTAALLRTTLIDEFDPWSGHSSSKLSQHILIQCTESHRRCEFEPREITTRS